MKPRKNFILTMLLGLMLAASATGMAQTPAQGDQKEKTHACCSMDTCCCNGDSCEMKAKDSAKKDTCCNMKQKNAKAKAKQKTA